MMTIEKDAVLDVLRTVYDPELGVNVVDLGLIYDVEVVAGMVVVVMTLTTPGCPLSGSLPEAARRAVLALPGVEAADVQLVFTPAWTPGRMSAAARRQLGY